MKIIIEVDGRHHFREMSIWNSNPEAVHDQDIYKMKCALQNGYSILRLNQADVWKRQSFWKTHVITALQQIQQVKVRYLSDDEEIYKKHIDSMLESIECMNTI